MLADSRVSSKHDPLSTLALPYALNQQATDCHFETMSLSSLPTWVHAYIQAHTSSEPVACKH